MDKGPEFSPAEEFCEDVTGVDGPINVNKINDTSSNGGADTVVGESVMTLVEVGMRNGGGGNDTLIVSKHPRWAINRNTHHAKSVSKVHDLFSGLTSSHEFKSISGCFNHILLLAEPLDGSLIHQVYDTCHRSTSD